MTLARAFEKAVASHVAGRTGGLTHKDQGDWDLSKIDCFGENLYSQLRGYADFIMGLSQRNHFVIMVIDNSQ